MFDRSSAALFLLTCVALAVTPGPDMLLSLSRSLAQGSRAGIVSALGSAAGFYVHAVAAALGLSGAFAYVPAAYDAVRYAGALYLAFLAWQLLRSGAVLPVSPARVGPASLSRIFRQAFLVNLLNPKAILFFIALFPQFLQGDGTAMLGQAVGLTTIINLFCVAVLVPAALTAGRVGRWMADHPRAMRLQSWFLAAVFAGLALRLVLSDRR